MAVATLFVDAGNSRVKWRHSGAATAASHYDALAPLHTAATHVERAVLSCVVHDARRQRLLRALSDVEVLEAKTTALLAGVRCAYDHQPAHLGIDRWLAIVAAYHQYGANTVIDAGSAVTIDLTDDQGQHLGGYILPGLGGQRAALELLLPGRDWPRQAQKRPATNTAQAMANGALLAVAGAINDVLANTSQPAILLGGDAAQLQPLLTTPSLHLAPDLIFDGLAIWLQSQSDTAPPRT